jgi:hypothetical protein
LCYLAHLQVVNLDRNLNCILYSVLLECITLVQQYYYVGEVYVVVCSSGRTVVRSTTVIQYCVLLLATNLYWICIIELIWSEDIMYRSAVTVGSKIENLLIMRN